MTAHIDLRIGLPETNRHIKTRIRSGEIKGQSRRNDCTQIMGQSRLLFRNNFSAAGSRSLTTIFPLASKRKLVGVSSMDNLLASLPSRSKYCFQGSLYC